MGCGSVYKPLEPPYTPNYIADITPSRWSKDKTVLYYSIKGASSDIPFIDIHKTLVSGINLWAESTQLILNFEEREDNPDITISVVSPTELEPLGDFVRGVSFLSYKSGFIDKVNIKIARNLIPVEMKATMAHEMGHALGIRGHSSDSKDMMYLSSSFLKGISLSDHNTLRLMYKD